MSGVEAWAAWGFELWVFSDVALQQISGMRQFAGFEQGLHGVGAPGKLVISRVISRVTIPIILLRGIITTLIITHEPPSKGSLRAAVSTPSSTRV